MMLELLSPAGGPDQLNAAVRAGADAVYLGMGSFNARRNADNFEGDALAQACSYAHLRGASVFVALNTIILPDELDEVLACARDAYAAGADALIIQDIGLARQVASAFPDRPVHLSTQANIHDSWGVEAAALLGADRITLARELSLAEIAHLSSLAADHGMQTEVFVHGALCVCYSGQCLMSSLIGQRSANRGLCAQACRLPYALRAEGRDAASGAGEFLLSPKDLCAVDLIGGLVDAGVTSFKIEGRMKSPEYVSAVTGVYRKVLDGLLEGERAKAGEDDRSLLESVFTRGFTTAYLEGERGNGIMSYQRPNNRGAFIGRVKAVRDGVAHIQCERPLVEGDIIEFWTGRGRSALTVPAGFRMEGGAARVALDAKGAAVRASDRVFRVRSAEAAFRPDGHEPRIPLDCRAKAVIGEPLKVAFSVPRVPRPGASPAEEAIIRRLAQRCGGEGLAASASGPVVEPARSKELTEGEAAEHIGRMGQTPFRMASFAADISGGAGMGFSQLHHARAEALDGMEQRILDPYRARRSMPLPSADAPSRACPASEPAIFALATNPACARAAKRAGAQAVYVPALAYRRGQASMAGAISAQAAQAGYPNGCVVQMPAICHDALGGSREERLGIDPWEYARPGKPILAESIAGLVRAAAMDALPEAGASLPLTNAFALRTAAQLGAARAWLSPELNLSQMARLASQSPIPLGVQVAGALQLMVTEHCPLMAEGPCDEHCPACSRRMAPHDLEDRKGYRFPVVTDALGRGHLYNSVPLDAVPAIPDLLDAGISSFLVDASLMDPEQAAQAVGRAIHALQSAQTGRPPEKKLPNTTSGHLFRGVV